MKSLSLFLLILISFSIVLPQKASLAFLNIEEPKSKLVPAKLQFINGSNSTIEIFWLKSPTERVSNGKVQPHKDSIISTYIGHQFVVVDQTDKSETTVTSEVFIQAHRHGGLPAIYTQQLSAEGFPIVASAKVNPYALKEAAYIFNLMLAKRPDVRNAMIKSGSRLSIYAHNEFTTDLPEWSKLADEPEPGFEDISAKDFWAARARGMGGSETDPYCSCAEENLLAFEGDPYSTENILIHEIAHNIHLRGMNNVDPSFDIRLNETYKSAMNKGLWKGKYASINRYEYFAEGVQSWFDDNREHDHDHNHVNTRVELVDYDPGLASLCEEVFGDTKVRYTKPTTRLTDHMQGYDPTKSPKFEWPAHLAKVKLQIRKKAQERSDKANNIKSEKPPEPEPYK